MIKSTPLQHPILSAAFGLFLFASIITYYNHSTTNDYNTLLQSLDPLSIIDTADASTIETNNIDDRSAQATAHRIGGFSNVTNLTDNPNDSVYPQIAASESNVYAVWEESNTTDLSNNNYDIYIKKSADGGENFAGNSNSSATETTTEVLNLSNNPGFSNHPQIAANDEKVHVGWIDDSLGNNEIFLARSIDNGSTFSDPINLSNTTNTNSRNLELTAFKNNVYAVWLDEDRQGNGIILFKASNDGGETFGNPITIARNVTTNNDFTFPKVAAYGNNVYIAWNEADNWSTQGEGEIITDLLYVKSSDRGNTFSPPVKLNNNGEKVGEAQLAAYNNAVYVVWGSSPYDHVTSNLFFTKSMDNGNTFSNATEVIIDNFVNPSNVEIVVVGNNNSEANREQSLSPMSSSHHVQQQPHLYIAGQVPLSDENEDIFLAFSTDNGDTFSQTTTNLSNNSEFSECPSIAASPNNIYVIWQDRTPGNNEALFTKAQV
ncbi:MAG: glycoside hydrolase [Thermoproteota archaeon]|nr:glycoside hydrolase [Thermoproteota archaeon]